MKKDLSEKEINETIVELRQKIQKQQFGTRNKNVKDIKNLRREIARLETMKSAHAK